MKAKDKELKEFRRILRKLTAKSDRVMACCSKPEFECVCEVGFLPSTVAELIDRLLCLELNLNPNNHQQCLPFTIEERVRLIIWLIQDEIKANLKLIKGQKGERQMSGAFLKGTIVGVLLGLCPLVIWIILTT